MAIVFHERTEEFHLYNREISYIMKLLPDRSVGQLYYGKGFATGETMAICWNMR